MSSKRAKNLKSRALSRIILVNGEDSSFEKLFESIQAGYFDSLTVSEDLKSAKLQRFRWKLNEALKLCFNSLNRPPPYTLRRIVDRNKYSTTNGLTFLFMRRQ